MNEHKKHRLFLVLGSFFLVNAFIAEFVGVKIFSLEKTLGLDPVIFNFFGYNHSFNMTAGVILWPMVFVLTDIINEYFGKKGVKTLSFIAVVLIAYSFIMVYSTLDLAPADFWTLRQTQTGVVNMDVAYKNVFGQGLWIITGSISAFLVGQIADVTVFQFVKRKMGDRGIWLRATLSTLVSQLIDSYVVLFIAFKLGAGFDTRLVLGIGLVNYIYKFIMAVAMIPLLYLVRGAIHRYLGNELAEKMIAEAGGKGEEELKPLII